MTPLLPRVGDDARHAVSPELWSQVAREIAARHGLRGDPEPYPTGSDLVCRVGDRVLKLSTPAWATQIEAEARCLEALHGRLPCAVPELEARGTFEGWPYLVMRRLPGLSLARVWPELDDRERVRLAGRLGAATAALHAAPIPDLGLPRWGETLSELRTGLVERQRRRGVSEAWLAQLEPFVRRVEPLPACGLVFLHTELLGEHVLLEDTPRGWDVSGLIDFGDARAGAAEYDMVAPVEFVFRGQPGCLRGFLQGYGYPAEALGLELRRRLLTWGLLHRFGSLPRMLAAAGDPAPRALEDLLQRLYAL
ncbi:MAG: aminoglycoside 3'-phosphotransferase/choline kinase family protein [Planctomycetota bacterium]